MKAPWVNVDCIALFQILAQWKDNIDGNEFNIFPSIEILNVISVLSMIYERSIKCILDIRLHNFNLKTLRTSVWVWNFKWTNFLNSLVYIVIPVKIKKNAIVFGIHKVHDEQMNKPFWADCNFVDLFIDKYVKYHLQNIANSLFWHFYFGSRDSIKIHPLLQAFLCDSSWRFETIDLYGFSSDCLVKG